MSPVAAAAVSPENVLKVRILSPHPGPTESDSMGLGSYRPQDFEQIFQIPMQVKMSEVCSRLLAV